MNVPYGHSILGLKIHTVRENLSEKSSLLRASGCGDGADVDGGDGDGGDDDDSIWKQ